MGSLARGSIDGERAETPMTASEARPRGAAPRMRGEVKHLRDAMLYREVLRLRWARDPTPTASAGLIYGLRRETVSRLINAIPPAIRSKIESQYRRELRERLAWARDEIAGA